MLRFAPSFPLIVSLALLPLARSAEVEWASTGSHRSTPLRVSGEGKTGFSLVPSSTSGLLFTNQLAEARSLTNQIYLNGSGVAAGDIDGDGWCDLYFCGLDNPNELYRNLGNWRFEEITTKAGVACADQASTGAAFADIDADGDLDLLVSGIARGVRLFLNDGKARFSETTAQYGLSGRTAGMSLALADIDGDGFLDLYLVNYRNNTFRDEPEKRFRVNNSGGRFELLTVDGRSVTEPDLAGRFSVDPASGVVENGEPDILFLNRGGKKFERVSWTEGAFLDEAGRPVETPYDWGLSAMFRDVNGDGAPDLYVCNDFQSQDRFWMNDGTGRFRLISKSSLGHTSLFSMGVDFADLDRDGRDEFFVCDMLSRDHIRRQTQRMDRAPVAMLNARLADRPQYPRNTFFWNRGDGSFAEIGQLSEVQASEWSWCPAFLDVDLDGYEDLVITAGHARDLMNIDIAAKIEEVRKSRNIPWREQMEMRRQFPRLAFPLLGFQNNRDLTFRFTGSEWGFTNSYVGQGLALADLDNDGGLDLVVNTLNGPALLYRNESSAPRIAVRLRGNAPNTRGIGAKVTVLNGPVPMQSQEMIAGGRYLSSDDPMRTFAAGSSTSLDIRVRWRSGRETLLKDAKPNRAYEISEADSVVPTASSVATPPPLFRDISEQLHHVHQDEAFDDFQRQPLLPRKFSNLGPGITWFDLDGDGWEELIIGSGRRGTIAVFQNRGGKLERMEVAPLSKPGTRDRTTILGWNQEGARSLLVGSANYEDGLTNGPCVRQFIWNATTMDDSLPGLSSSSGPLALADADGDGDLDLFVGGRVIAGRFPNPASSAFFRNEGGKLTLDEKLSRTFARIGLVSAAVWSDLDDDGRPELILACDGGPIRVFSLRQNEFNDLTEAYGLTKWVGWWNSVATGDFDGDGRMDIVAGNWGRNTKYQNYLPDGYRIYFQDTPEAVSTRIVEAVRDPFSNRIVPVEDRDSLTILFPEFKQRYSTFFDFASASLGEMVDLRTFSHLQINTADSMLFLNRGKGFESHSLPVQAQFSPVFGIAVGDVDADGKDDLFLAQNFFGVPNGTGRYDAGQGLLLRGDGRGGFEPLSSVRSGVAIYGEGRGAAFCDFDHDGRLDLAVGQNSGPTKLYRNESSASGLRITLKGPPANPSGIGASVRLVYRDGRSGPLHEVHAGEGYWSQAGGSAILGPIKDVEAVEVHWPGHQRRVIRVEPGANELVIE